MSAPIRLVLTHCNDLASAERLARQAVEERLAACVNIQRSVRSIYRWQGQIETADEVGLVFKTAADRVASLLEALKRWHPYELPELLVVDTDSVLPAYQDWVISETRQQPA